jgi:transposase
VQNETCGHHGRRDDPLWRVRRRLSIAAERLTVDPHERLVGLLRAGDPRQEVWLAWNAKEAGRKREGSGKEAGRKREGSGKEAVRQTYAHSDPELADQWVAEIIRNFADDTIPIEVRRLGRTTKKWAAQITAWHRPHVSNGPTEGVNDLGRAH